MTIRLRLSIKCVDAYKLLLKNDEYNYHKENYNELYQAIF